MFEQKGGFNSIVASSRVRFARNIKGYAYAQQTEKVKKEIADRVWAALQTVPILATEFEKVRIEPHSMKAQAMVERNLISPFLVQHGGWIIVSKNENASILIGEEDHLRLQVMGTGLCPKECLEEAQRLAQVVESNIPMDYDRKLGYLTACPTNIGTGLRVSVMLHLPMLTQTNQIAEMIGWAGSQGCAVRGAFGEGSRAQADLYQVSNQVTLGFSEEALAAKLIEVCTKLIEVEQKMRQMMHEKDTIGLEDRLCRAMGILKNARRISTEEAEQMLSNVLVGLQLDVLKGIAPQEVYMAERAIRPATMLCQSGKTDMSVEERDEVRAKWLREHIGDKICIEI